MRRPTPYARAICFVEFIEFELASGLVLVVAYGPDVSGIDEKSPLENPEQFGAVFEAPGRDVMSPH